MKVLIPLQKVQKNYKVVLDDYRNSETYQKEESCGGLTPEKLLYSFSVSWQLSS